MNAADGVVLVERGRAVVSKATGLVDEAGVHVEKGEGEECLLASVVGAEQSRGVFPSPINTRKLNDNLVIFKNHRFFFFWKIRFAL